MGRKLFVGNLPYDITDDDLNDAFSDSGVVRSARVISDRETGRSRGFGFVEFSTDEDAALAVQNWNEKELGGRKLTVNEAQERSRGGGDGRSGSSDRGRGDGRGDGRGKKGRTNRGRRDGGDSHDGGW